MDTKNAEEQKKKKNRSTYIEMTTPKREMVEYNNSTSIKERQT